MPQLFGALLISILLIVLQFYILFYCYTTNIVNISRKFKAKMINGELSIYVSLKIFLIRKSMTQLTPSFE